MKGSEQLHEHWACAYRQYAGSLLGEIRNVDHIRSQ